MSCLWGRWRKKMFLSDLSSVDLNETFSKWAFMKTFYSYSLVKWKTSVDKPPASFHFFFLLSSPFSIHQKTVIDRYDLIPKETKPIFPMHFNGHHEYYVCFPAEVWTYNVIFCVINSEHHKGAPKTKKNDNNNLSCAFKKRMTLSMWLCVN